MFLVRPLGAGPASLFPPSPPSPPVPRPSKLPAPSLWTFASASPSTRESFLTFPTHITSLHLQEHSSSLGSFCSLYSFSPSWFIGWKPTICQTLWLVLGIKCWAKPNTVPALMELNIHRGRQLLNKTEQWQLWIRPLREEKLCQATLDQGSRSGGRSQRPCFSPPMTPWIPVPLSLCWHRSAHRWAPWGG